MAKVTIARVYGEGFESIITLENKGEKEVVRIPKTDLDIDADGANGQNGKQAAYRVGNTGSELLANGGMGMRSGRVVGTSSWYADIVIVDSEGHPLVLENGIIPSKTAYKFPGKSSRDPAAYLDSETVPYIVVPPIVRTRPRGIVLGCLCYVYFKNVRVAAIVGDIGPRTKTGEGSIELARRLGIPSSPRTGGWDKPDLDFEIYPGEQAILDGVAYPLLAA